MTGTFFPACVTVGDEFIAGRDLKFTSRGYELWSLSLPPCAVTDGDAADMQSHVFTCAQINRQSEQFPWMWWRAPPNRFLTTLYCCEAFYKLSLVKTVMMEIMAANALCDVNINLLINATERRQLMNVLLHSSLVTTLKQLSTEGRPFASMKMCFFGGGRGMMSLKGPAERVCLIKWRFGVKI